MITPLYFFLFFLLGLKSTFLFSSLYVLDFPVSYLLIVFPLIYFLIYYCPFNSSSSIESYFFSISLFIFFFFLSLSFTSSAPFLFLFFLELCVILNILFLLNFSKDLDKVSSIFFMIFFNMMGSVPFFWYCSWHSVLNYWESCSSFFVLACFSVLLSSKLPIFIFHFWLTKAHVSASGSGSMLLASLMLKIGSIGFLKWGFLFSFLFFAPSPFFFSFMLWGSIFHLLVMLRFFDLKYLVACSSVVHVSVLMPLCLLHSDISYYSSSISMVSHSLVSCFIFFLVTLLYELCYERSTSSSKSLESFSTSFSMFMFFWFLLNLGFPPFLSFLSELYFLLFFFSFDIFSLFLFLLVLTISGMAFFSVISMFLYSKKIMMGQENLSLIRYLMNFFYITFFLLLCVYS